MNSVFKEICWKGVLVFFDDILVYSSTTVEHLKLLEEVFRQNKLFVGEPKEIHYLWNWGIYWYKQGRGHDIPNSSFGRKKYYVYWIRSSVSMNTWMRFFLFFLNRTPHLHLPPNLGAEVKSILVCTSLNLHTRARLNILFKQSNNGFSMTWPFNLVN